jgi:hypothetical protein
MIAHPAARKLNPQQLQTIKHLTSTRANPRNIIGLIKKDTPTQLVIPRDICNQVATIRRQKLGDKSSMEYLREQLIQHQWKHEFIQDTTGHMTYLMFAHPTSIELANKYNRAFVLDCTYKTNRFKMPLLHIIGVTASNLSFTIALCFMLNEGTESYTWALRTFFNWLSLPEGHYPVLCTDRELALLGAIAIVRPLSPHLLCIWHINKNVASNTKECFTQEGWVEFLQDWMHLINSDTVSDYEANYMTFTNKYAHSAPRALRYICDTWLTLYRERFVRAWTSCYLHLGNAATSRVEGAHAMIKKYIGGSVGDILDVWEAIDNALSAQHNAIVAATQEDRIQTLLFARKNPLFIHLNKRVSRYALSLIYDQLSLAKRATSEAPIGQCANHWTRSMGLPCKHHLAALVANNNQPIPLSDIHPFWRTDESANDIAYLPLLDPRMPEPRPPRAAPAASGSAASGGAGKKQKAPPKCSNCGEIGHTIRKCPMP